MFILSGGKYNLLDFVLNIVHADNNYHRNSLKILIIWLSFFSLVAISPLSIYKFNIEPYIESLIAQNSKYNIPNYYPSNVFEKYGDIKGEKFEESNRILVFSDPASVVQNKLLLRKTIYATINKELNESSSKRIELCKDLIHYSVLNDFIGNLNDSIDQTKIVLVYLKRKTSFSGLSFTYLYYYDNKSPDRFLYGGVNLDSLIKSYNSFPETFLKTVSNILKIDEENLKRRLKEEGKIIFSPDELSKIDKAPNKIYIRFRLIYKQSLLILYNHQNIEFFHFLKGRFL
jgi:hypothetical protein